MKLLKLLALTVFLAGGVFAQKESATAEAIFDGPAQPTVVKLPLPAIPKGGIKAWLGGSVSVAVALDDQGKVTSVDDATGPYPVCQSVTDPNVLALRLAATDAARKAIFKPAILESQPISVKGHVIYTFGTEAVNEKQTDRMTMIGDSNNNTGARVVDSGKSSSLTNTDPSQLPKIVSGGVLNGKANSLARPSYPPAARAVRAGGAVSVRVVISEDGTMYSAAAISGHPLLRHASEIAACSARFSPTLLSGQPVKVAGVITYNFVP